MSYKNKGIKFVVKASNSDTGEYSEKEFGEREGERATDYFQYLANKYKILPGYFDGVDS